MAAVASGALYALGWRVAAVVAASFAVAGLLAALLLTPMGLSRLDRAVEGVALFVGRVVTHLLLWPVFVLGVIPLGLLRRRHDALGQRPTQAPSHWGRREKGVSSLDRTF